MADLFRKTKSLYASTANTFGTGTGVTITPNSVSGLPTDTEITLTFDRVDASGVATPNSMERIIGTISGGNFVVRTSPSSGRGADGTSDQAHTSPVVEYVPNAKDINDMVDGINAEHTQAGLHDIAAMITGGSVIDEDSMATNSAVKVPTQQSVKAYVDASLVTTSWQASADTWTRTGNYTFTIAGADRTAIYTKGTKLRYKDGGSFEYGYVKSSAFSTDTTVTLVTNADYAMAATTITEPGYSYAENPPGFPDWFSFTTTWTGFSVDPAATLVYFKLTSKMCSFYLPDSTAGTSNATSLTFQVPVNSKRNYNNLAFIAPQDSGTISSTPGHLLMTNGSPTVTAYKAFSQVAWTNSGGKNIFIPVVSFEWD